MSVFFGTLMSLKESESKFLNEEKSFFTYFRTKRPTSEQIENYIGLDECVLFDQKRNNKASIRYSLVNPNSYSDIATNKKLLMQRFEDVKSALDKNKFNAENQEIWIAYCYSSALLLEQFFHHYEKLSEEKRFRRLRKELKNRLDKKPAQVKPILSKSFSQHCFDEIEKGFVKFLNVPAHTEELRSWVGYLNIQRLFWTFTRIDLTAGFRLAESTHLIDKIEKIFHRQIDLEKVIHTMEAPNGILRGLSVGFFAARLLLELGVAAKHALAPSSAEEKHLSGWQRFFGELYERRVNIVNDLVWMTVNLTTNYAYLFHIPAAVAGWMTAGFLFFDAAWILINWLIENHNYDIQIEMCNKRISDIRKALDNLKEDDPEYDAKYKQLTKDLQDEGVLLKERLAKKNGAFAYALFNATGAIFLASGFALPMLFSPAGIAFAAYFLCVVGVAMYLSASSFKNLYMKGKEVAEEMEYAKGGKHSPRLQQVQKEYEAAKKDFAMTMLKNTVMPMLMITTIAICWEAAVVITALYISYQLFAAYRKHQQEQQALPGGHSEPYTGPFALA